MTYHTKKIIKSFVWFIEGNFSQAQRLEVRGDVCDARGGEVSGVLLGRTVDEGSGSYAPGGDLLHARTGARLLRISDSYGDANSPMRAAGGHFVVLDGRGRNRGRVREDSS